MRYIVDRLQEIVNFIFIFFHIFIQREPGSFLPLEAEICIVLSETSPVIFCVHSGYVLVYYANLNFPDQKKKKVSLSFYTAQKGHFTITFNICYRNKISNTIYPPNA